MRTLDSLRRDLGNARATHTPKLASGRCCAPEATYECIRGLIRAAGITRVANVTGLDTIGVLVVMVVRPNARSLSVSQGKGLSMAAAKVSGIMESLECFHAERVTGPMYIGRYADLANSHDIVDPLSLPLT